MRGAVAEEEFALRQATFAAGGATLEAPDPSENPCASWRRGWRIAAFWPCPTPCRPAAPRL
ncbi:hypothetical protein [Brevundimonas denitrificans]|uniref:hypothetical protein n=1 Tax=Brevundimonas denitrificans TaxID=1443434 RepID=UPI00352E78CD